MPPSSVNAEKLLGSSAISRHWQLANSERHVAEEGSKSDGSVSFAGQGRSAMRAAPEALAHRHRLCADHFRLNSSGEAFPLAKRQAKRFRNSELVSFDPATSTSVSAASSPNSATSFTRQTSFCIGPPFPKKAILTLENLNTPHDLACSPLQPCAFKTLCLVSAPRQEPEKRVRREPGKVPCVTLHEIVRHHFSLFNGLRLHKTRGFA